MLAVHDLADRLQIQRQRARFSLRPFHPLQPIAGPAAQCLKCLAIEQFFLRHPQNQVSDYAITRKPSTVSLDELFLPLPAARGARITVQHLEESKLRSNPTINNNIDIILISFAK
ncbi:hypothetical protein BCEP4_60135 [Burkholderia cepacia]|nr:hypothetical protein BCEP4_60135 [Burkholderia cepacia]